MVCRHPGLAKLPPRSRNGNVGGGTLLHRLIKEGLCPSQVDVRELRRPRTPPNGTQITKDLNSLVLRNVGDLARARQVTDVLAWANVGVSRGADGQRFESCWGNFGRFGRECAVKYLPQLDGLRALAVMAVILYHAGFETFGGGFVGVDVFFVLSGYLITIIILSDLAQGKFSLIQFYLRRARRLLPALFLVTAISIPLAWLWLPPSPMRDFSQSLVAVPLFASNFLFWTETDYFDTASELKPLLHTWSLALEGQFYLLFPILLIALYRTRGKLLIFVLSTLGLVSVALAQWVSSISPAMNFYLLPTRFWEFLIGSLTAIYILKSKNGPPKRHNAEIFGALGLGMVIYSVFTFSAQTPFPSAYALIPTIGTALVIVFSSGETLLGRVLATKYLVGAGLVSYSAYLFHYPIFVFARQSGAEPSSLLWASVLIFFSFSMAYLSWKFVEKPFRSRSLVPAKQFLKISSGVAVGLIALGLLGHVNEGFPAPQEAKLLPPQTESVLSENFFVLGDSHADHLIPGLHNITDGYVQNYTSGGCIPFRNVDRYDYRFTPGDCARTINSHLNAIADEDPEGYVLLSSMGPVYLEGTAFRGKDTDRVTGLGVEMITDQAMKDRWRVYEIGMRSTLKELSRLRNSTIIMAIDVPELGIEDGCQKTSKELNLGFLVLPDLSRGQPADCYVPRYEFDTRTTRYHDLVKAVASEFPEVLLFDPTEYFCDEIKCAGIDSEYGFLYRDVDHLSKTGSDYYAKHLAKFLETASSY